jgi:predicted RNase H-like HicB family nuclease
MEAKMTLIYWKSDKFWLGKLLEHPEIMTQGETLEELEENIKDAYLIMAFDEIPEGSSMYRTPYGNLLVRHRRTSSAKIVQALG